MTPDACIVLALHTHDSAIWKTQYAGLCRYCRPRGWTVRDCCLGRSVHLRTLRRLVRDARVVGVISSLSIRLPPAVRARVPVVCFDCPRTAVPEGIPHIRHDADQTAHLAAGELMSLPLRCLAYAHLPSDMYWSRERAAAFAREILRRGGHLGPAFRQPGVSDRRRLLPAVVRWLAGLPKPCGVFAANDEMAQVVVQACVRAHLRVPDDVAVVGVDNDPRFCEGAVPISSVMPDWDAGAFLAARALDRIVRADARAVEATAFRPLGLMRRQSSGGGHRARQEPRIQEAVGLIRAEACAGLRAARVLGVMRGARRSAEQTFRSVTGMSVLEAIRRARFENAQILLETTRRDVAYVAQASGYRSVPTFCRTFKAALGLSPLEWRAKSRA